MRTPVHTRLRTLREQLNLSQDKLGKKCGHNQNWISGRELGNVDLLADQALQIIDAMGLAGELIVLPAEHRELLGRLGDLDPTHAALAIRFALALSRLDEDAREMLEGMVDLAERQSRKAAG